MISAEAYCFEKVLSFIETLTGITLPETNYRFVKSYIADRTGALKISAEDYLSLVKSDASERDMFLDAVTINETYFFREQKHFRVLVENVFPEIRKNTPRQLKIWSAACSTGEEAISLAALSASFLGNLTDLRVYASDINPFAVGMLQKGVYGRNSFREDGSDFHSLLGKDASDSVDVFRTPGKYLDLIIPLQLNLADESYDPVPENIDIVFLRNMLIYVRTGMRSGILDRIVSHMTPGGYLFLSSSEIPLLGHVELVLQNSGNCYFFRKKQPQEKKAGIIPDREMIIQPYQTKNIVTAKTSYENRRVLLSEILKHISRRLNNPVYEQPGTDAFIAAVDYLKTMYFLNSGELEKAGEAEKKLIEKWGENEITDYFRGIKFLRNSDYDSAVKLFSAALRQNPGFWPAIYQRASIEKDRNPGKALRDYKDCLRSIDAYIRSGNFSYQFLLEGFNARYFAEVCRGWISRMEKKGA